jgi:uncharacterized protein YigA (DUF484 family)
MSQRQERMAINNNAERVIAEYLRAHPEFFNRHPELLDVLQIPHPCGSAVSLIERQVQHLRQQNSQLRKKLRDLVKIARENDSLSKRMQHLHLTLIECTQLDDMLNGVQSVLRDQFNADFTSFRLALSQPPDGLLTEHDRLSPAALSLFRAVFDSGRPLCGRLTIQQRQHLFDDAAAEVASVALIPLGGMDWKGLLAIGSNDAGRFHPAMGTLFLSRIGELIGYALQPHLHALAPAAPLG